jgi:hypothetical protein
VIKKIKSPSALLIKQYTMKRYGGVDVYIHVLLTLALVVGEWSASRLGAFTPEESALRNPLDRKLDGSQSWSG